MPAESVKECQVSMRKQTKNDRSFLLHTTQNLQAVLSAKNVRIVSLHRAYRGSHCYVVGSTGPTGPSGPTGQPGTPGFQGIPGYTGSTGYTGLSGVPGSPGGPGQSGPPGFLGATGSTGANASLLLTIF